MSLFPFRISYRHIMAGSLLLGTMATPAILIAKRAGSPQLPGPFGVNRKTNSVLLHNGWKITPAGTHSEQMGDLLMGGTLSPNGKWLAFVNGGGAAHQVHIADTVTGKVVSSIPVPRAQASGGVLFSLDGNHLYVSGANSGNVYRFAVDGMGQLSAEAPLQVGKLRGVLTPKPDPGKDAGRDPARQDAPEENAYLGGLTLSPDGKTLYASNLAADSLYALDAATGAVRAYSHLNSFDRPGALAISPDGKTLYAALWGRGVVLALDSNTLDAKGRMAVGAHPNTLLIVNSNPAVKAVTDADEGEERETARQSANTTPSARLFVACGNDDSVYAFDTVSNRLREKINLRLTPRSPAGSTPSALAISPDQKQLYVANSDNNAVAVVDVSVPGSSHVAGFIPTTWYPTMVAVSADGKRIFVGSGKGWGTGPNGEKRPIDPVAPAGAPYIVALLRGVLSTIDVPNAAQLATYTKQVVANTPYSDALLDKPAHAPQSGMSAIPSKPGDNSPIKYVLYLIKENRTYDQVFGDLKDAKGNKLGNGDPQLCLFGEDVTPNHHALAREFVTLDNLYANGEVSVDGHHWSNGAYVPDAMQRTWPSEYGGKGGTPIRYGDFGDPLADTPGGRIWDLCERAGVPFRTYYYHVDKRRSDEWARARRTGVRDYKAVDIFLKDLEGWQQKGEMPRFMVMALSEDHTTGTAPGRFTPKACVASNDLGVGKIVEACSKSRFWKQMAIFIIEDDAQNGPDHVDAHRTVALAVSPYTRNRGVDSTHYTTCSLLRSMELILGLPPMSQYDAAATPLYASFSNKADTSVYQCRTPKVDLDAKNTARSFGAVISSRLDLSEPDRLSLQDEDDLNRVLWHSIKGEQTPYPGIVRGNNR